MAAYRKTFIMISTSSSWCSFIAVCLPASHKTIKNNPPSHSQWTFFTHIHHPMTSKEAFISFYVFSLYWYHGWRNQFLNLKVCFVGQTMATQLQLKTLISKVILDFVTVTLSSKRVRDAILIFQVTRSKTYNYWWVWVLFFYFVESIWFYFK